MVQHRCFGICSSFLATAYCSFVLSGIAFDFSTVSFEHLLRGVALRFGYFAIRVQVVIGFTEDLAHLKSPQRLARIQRLVGNRHLSMRTSSTGLCARHGRHRLLDPLSAASLSA